MRECRNHFIKKEVGANVYKAWDTLIMYVQLQIQVCLSADKFLLYHLIHIQQHQCQISMRWENGKLLLVKSAIEYGVQFKIQLKSSEVTSLPWVAKERIY